MTPDSRSGATRKPIAKNLAQIVVAIVAAALIGAAIWRWRDNGWVSLVWLAGIVATNLIRAPHAKSTRANVVADERRQPLDSGLLAAVFLTFQVLPLVHLATGVFAFADYTLLGWAALVGCALEAAFLWLFWRSHADLGRNWSVKLEIRQDHDLVTGGVYARIRHPMYAAIFLGVLAQPLLIHNWIAGFLVLPAFTGLYWVRVANEEAMMRARFGDAYDAYTEKTGRLLPKYPR